MANIDELYKILELDINADENEIKKAYNRLSLKWHPDKNMNNVEEATKKFQEISDAKDKLINHKNNKNSNTQFSGTVKKEDNIIDTISITLEQIYNEECINYSYEHKIPCEFCKEYIKICNTCSGNGLIIQINRCGFFVQQIITGCNICNGRGIISDNYNCNKCNNLYYSYTTCNLNIKLNNEFGEGKQIVLSGRGHQIFNYSTDLVLIISEKPHMVYKRVNNDLFINIRLNIFEALFGYDKIIVHLDNNKLYIKSREKTEYNVIKKINNYGMKGGDLYIKFNYNLELNDEVLGILNKLYIINDIEIDNSITHVPLNIVSNDFSFPL